MAPLANAIDGSSSDGEFYVENDNSIYGHDAVYPFNFNAPSTYSLDALPLFDLPKVDARNSVSSVPKTPTHGDNQGCYNTILGTTGGLPTNAVYGSTSGPEFSTEDDNTIMDSAFDGLGALNPCDFPQSDVGNRFNSVPETPAQGDNQGSYNTIPGTIGGLLTNPVYGSTSGPEFSTEDIIMDSDYDGLSALYLFSLPQLDDGNSFDQGSFK